MRTAGVLACCVLLFPLIGTVQDEVPSYRATTLDKAQAQTPQRVELRAQLTYGNQLFYQNRFDQANQIFQSVLLAARTARLFDVQARAAGNIGSCQFARHEYQNALRSFLQARRLAETAGDRNEVAALDANIGSLYSQMGNLETAVGWMQDVADRMTGADRTLHLPEIQIQLATLRARQDLMSEAVQLFRQGIDGADRQANLNLYSIGWNRLGEEYLKRENLPAAERAFLEAFRVRKLNHLPLDSSYRNLGRLRLMQGDLPSAAHLLDRYVELAERPNGPLPVWDVYYSRGRVRLAQGRLQDALTDLRVAVRLARAWRWSAVANDAGRKGAEGMLDQVYAAFIEAGNRLYASTHDRALARETFAVAEENRASSLSALVSSQRTEALPSGYWEALNRLQSAEVTALRSGTAAAQQAAAHARAEVERLDGEQSEPANPGAEAGLTEQVQRLLDPHTALISYQLGDAASWIWAVDHTGLELYALPPRSEIEGRVSAVTRALRDESRADVDADKALYQTLFGRLAPRFSRKTRWLLAMDSGEHSARIHATERPTLFDIPVAALRLPVAPGKSQFLVEKHSTILIPGAAYWLKSVQQKGPRRSAPLFLGVGDPIYNTADPRRTAETPAPSKPGMLTAWAAPSHSLTLPRLVASGPELDACALAWQGDRVLLKGGAASRSALLEQLRRDPEVIHFATHFLSTAAGPATGLIALSLNGQGETELLSPEEIAHWRIHPELVVLSGCYSAQGAAAAGTGLLGLTRAWLAAGAHNVIASRWTTPDNTGPLFSALYRNLRISHHADAAEALRLAQLEMIRSGGWRAAARYWGAYSAVGGQWQAEKQ